MLIRIVKMTFKEEEVESFLGVFETTKGKIRGVEGCQRLELLRDINNRNSFFTYSYWDGEEYLEKYRKSELFLKVWAKTKVLFSAKPEAWSLQSETLVE